MKQIRDNVFQVTYSDLGKPSYHGFFKVDGLGEVLMDDADVNYIQQHIEKGVEPTFFVSKSTSLNGAYVVISRQRF